MTVIFLILMVLASLSLSVIYGLGPFGHPSRLHWHMKARQLPPLTIKAIKMVAFTIIICATIVLIVGDDTLLS